MKALTNKRKARNSVQTLPICLIRS